MILITLTILWFSTSLHWRHDGRDSVSNHQPHDCLLNRLFRRRSKKTLKLRVTGLCAGNSPVTGEFPAQMASNAENISIWWRHPDDDATHNNHRHLPKLRGICRVNSLWPSDAIWRHRTRSTLVQSLACCLTAPSHYLNQCWLIISEVLCQSHEDNFPKKAQCKEFDKY